MDDPHPSDDPADAEVYDFGAATPEDVLGDDFETVREEKSALGIMLFAALIPIMLVMTGLSALLGDWVWKAAPFVFIGLFLASRFAPLRMMWTSRKAIRLSNGEHYSGRAKRVLLAKAAALIGGSLVLGLYWLDLRAWLMDWTIPWPW